MFALVGDSGAGKSTLSDGCVELLGIDRVTAICLDDYHSLDRVGRTQRGITALHPDCNHLDLAAQHVRLLRAGEKIFKPVYDHSDGTFGPPEFITPAQVVLIHGLHGLYTPELRRHWDLSVYLDPDPELRIDWKIKRDMSKRGYTRAEVVKQLEERRHDSEAFIQPQRDLADILITFYPPADYAQTKDATKLNVRVTLRHPVPLPDVDDAIALAERRNGNAALRLIRGTAGADVVEVSGHISNAATQAVEDRMWDHMPSARHLRSDRLGVFQDGPVARRSNPLAVTQLILTYYLVKASALALKEQPNAMEAAVR
jgi:phosphoribulokinase